MTLADEAARERIRTDTGSTLFVEAGAGSGKTTELVNRIKRLVLHDTIPLKHVSAVTFTEMAAAELRERLREEFEIVRAGDDAAPAEIARLALDDLDGAAIGTLHAFAQRILTEHPIKAGIPPLIEVLDEVGSSVAFEERWKALLVSLLGDEAMEQPVLIGLALGIELKDIRSLALLLGRDWDLIADHVLAPAELPFAVGDLAPLALQGRIANDITSYCPDEDDALRKQFTLLKEALDRFDGAANDQGRLAELQAIADLKFSKNKGKQENWGGKKPEAVELGGAVVAAAAETIAGIIDRCLRHLTRWLGTEVLAAAKARRSSGRLEFHDLLVLSRELLRNDESVREALHTSYQRLLLDEFQDTDPIQIELAVRIAGGAAAGAPAWDDVAVPDGRLFVVGDPKQSIYRFRRASIATYMQAQQRIGTTLELTTNFRSQPSILEWIDTAFAALIQYEPDKQPAFAPLVPDRAPKEGTGPGVALLGSAQHDDLTGAVADPLRAREAEDVARAIARIQAEQWQVFDKREQRWRTARLHDIAVLLPVRKSLPFLEQALDDAGIAFRAEASSLVYEAQEVRDLLAGARAIADPSDTFALVTALRTPLFGCSDLQLWEFRRAGGVLHLSAPMKEELRSTPVGAAIRRLDGFASRARYLTPSEVLGALVADQRMLESHADDRRARDVWRRLRFVVDQARAWSEVAHGGLRAYLAWAAFQGAETSRVAESVLPERDSDAVRVMTVHAAKGLEFPIVIVSGMTTEKRGRSGVKLIWNAGGYAVKTSTSIHTDEFSSALELDEQMDEREKRRLLYVAATRARDHLVVSLHRTAKQVEAEDPPTLATLLASAVPADLLVRRPDVEAVRFEPKASAKVPAPPDHDGWLTTVGNAQKVSKHKPAVSASGLEGTEPELVLDEATEQQQGMAKGLRDLELPPWTKGRYGSAIGRAVHGVLQVVDLAAGAGTPEFDAAVEAQAVVEGVTEQVEMVRALAASALGSDLLQRAAARDHWRETYVGTVAEDETIVEGFIDLLYREDDGSLVVVDYKTDAVPPAEIPSRVTYYGPQIRAYVDGIRDATEELVKGVLLFLHPETVIEQAVE